MRSAAVLLLLALPGIAVAERAAVPAGANTASQLQEAATRCVAANPTGDICFDLHIALARRLLADGKHREAGEAAEAARKAALDAYDPIADRYDEARNMAEAAGRRPEDDPGFTALQTRWRGLWIDMAVAQGLRGDAAAGGGGFDAASAYSAAWSIRRSYGADDTVRREGLPYAAKAAAAYLAAGSPGEAEKILKDAVPSAEQLLGREHAVTIALLLYSARAQAIMGRNADAEALFTETRRRVASSGDVVAQADADAPFAVYLAAQDRGREALALQRSVVERLEAARAPTMRMAQAYRDLAEVSSGEAALSLAGRAVDLHIAAFGAEHPQTARARIAAAALLDREGALVEGERERATGIAILSRHLTVLHPEIGLAQLRQAENLVLQHRCADARAAAGYAVDSFTYEAGDGRTANSGKDHPNTARAHFLIGFCELDSGDARGLARMQTAIRIQRATLAPTHAERLMTELVLGVIAQRTGNLADALRQYRIVTAAAEERVRGFTGFDAAAQREQAQFAPVHAAFIRAAWDASRVTGM